MRLANKVAIVTGASRSIGKMIAIKYAAEGASVVVNYANDSKAAEDVVQMIRSAGGKATPYRADVSDEMAVQQLVAHTIETYGRIDILVNNAAIHERLSWLDISGDAWDRMMQVNVKSQFLCAKAVYPYMKQQGGGSIINVSSVVFWVGVKDGAHYVASKGAIVGLTRALAREAGPDRVRVNCITPGAIMTETELDNVGSQEKLDAAVAYIMNEQSLKRRITTDDLVGTFVYLACDDSSGVTGQCVNVDGGWYMH